MERDMSAGGNCYSVDFAYTRASCFSLVGWLWVFSDKSDFDAPGERVQPYKASVE